MSSLSEARELLNEQLVLQMKKDFFASLVTHWTKVSLLIKNFIQSKQVKLLQDSEGAVWEIALTPFNCLQKKDFSGDVEAAILPSGSTMTYALQVPKLSSQDTLLAIQAYMEEQMGQEISQDSSIVYLEQKSSARGERRVTAVFTQQRTIDEWIDKRNQENNISALWFIPKQLCLQAFFENHVLNSPLFILDLTPSEITLIFIQEGHLMACRSLPLAPSADEEDKEKRRSATIKQIETSLLSWNNTTSENPPQIVLTGSAKDEWRSHLQRGLSYNFYEPEQSNASQYTYASLIGAAHLSRASLTGPLPPSVLSSSKTPFQKAWTKTLVLAATTSLVLSFLFYCSEKKQESLLKDAIEKEFVSIAQEPWANSFKDFLPSNIQGYENAQEAIDKVITEMKKQSLYPLTPNVPSVSAIIQWIEKQVHDISPQMEAITIQKMTYSFVQYPTIDQPKKHYQLKIELEFTTTNTQVARAFHDRLLSPQNDLIDLKSEVKWNVSQDVYKTTFFIKDKTNYNSLM